MQKTIRWKRATATENAHSADRRFFIYPQYYGTTSPQGYELHDTSTGARSSHDTVTLAKAAAEAILRPGVVRPNPLPVPFISKLSGSDMGTLQEDARTVVYHLNQANTVMMGPLFPHGRDYPDFEQFNAARQAWLDLSAWVRNVVATVEQWQELVQQKQENPQGVMLATDPEVSA